MNMLDVFIVVAAAGAAAGGYRLGLLARVVSWIGMGLGLFVSAALLPNVLSSLQSASPGTRLAATAGLLLGGSFVGQGLGLLVGSRLHLALPTGSARQVDRGGGAVAGVFGVIIAVWVLTPALTDVPGWPSQQARSSTVTRAIAELAGPPPDTMQALRRLVGENAFPQVFSALQPSPEVGPPPAESGLSPELIAQVTRSTLKIEGIACRRVQDGSGFVVGGELVVTNAHVVAGEDETDVISPDGSRFDAVVVAFDSDRDLAVLRVPGLPAAPLPLSDTEAGGTGAVFGYPGGGDLRVSPFQVSEEVEAVGRDLYDRHETRRQVFVLASDLHPGDSGGALVDQAGDVVGVAFAIAPDRPQTAYALTNDELKAVLGGDLSQERDTGDCLR